jgi:hypothetical protein
LNPISRSDWKAQKKMPKLRFLTIICMSLLLFFVYGCKKGSNESESPEASTHQNQQGEQAGHEHEQGEQAGHEHEQGEHAEEGEKEEHAGEGEEAGQRISIDGIHDEVRKGVRLILSFDNESSSFDGTVENVTEKTISRVRVEVHLSYGNELGPTEPIDLAPGKKVSVKLSTEGQSFSWWKAHAETGASEH